MSECKLASVPINPGFLETCSGDCKRVKKEEYQSIIGALMYLSVTTRPDIMHTISKLSQFNTDPHIEHMHAAKHVLRYLKSTQDLCLLYKRSNLNVTGFTDADWGGSTIDRKSYTGYLFYAWYRGSLKNNSQLP